MTISELVFLVQICLCFTAVNSLAVFNANESLSRIPRQSNNHGCILPDQPQFGKWVIYQASRQPQPGTPVPPGTILQVSCQNQYKLDGEAAIVCIDNEWSTKIGRCLKTCPSLHNTALVSVTCTYNNRKMPDCIDAVDGTIARFTCADFYEDKGLERNPIHVCFNGRWSNRAPECVPICGQKTPGKNPTLIVGGSNVTKGSYPWQVAIYNVHTKVLLCGGSLVNQRVVLTAAHCVTDDKGVKISQEVFMLAVGKYYRNYSDSRDKDEAQFSPVHEIFVPKQYKGDIQNYFGDIALLVSKQTFTLSTRVQPVCVDWASNHNSLSDPSRTKHGYVPGWGFTAEYKDPSEILKDLKVPLISDDQCDQHLPDDYKKFMTSDKLCAGFLDTGTSVCRGDSGGGLVTGYDGRYYVIAVVSLSPQAPTREGGCDSQQYALFTRVSSYINIILDYEVRYRPSIFGEVDCEHDPLCKTGTDILPTTTTTTTTTSRPFRPTSSCFLPNHPVSGKWSIFGPDSTLSPGTTVLPGSILKVSCNEGFQLVGQELTVCEKGRWVPEPASCSKTCPPMRSTETVKITCTIRGEKIEECENPTDGTIARHQCAPFYEDLQMAKYPIRVCRNGSWDLATPECIPICGVKSVDAQPLIVNGTIAKKGDYPWHVGLYRGRSKRFVCNGALISQKVILTAAHCVTNFGGQLNSKEDYTVAVGKYFRDFYDPLDDESQTSEIEQMFIPLQYGGTKSNYVGDIAVLVAKQTFTLSRRVQPVCVDWALKYDINTFEIGYISGWGYTMPNARPSEELRELRVPLVTKKQCQDVFSDDFASFITFDKLCAGYVNMSTSACNGDAGGALVTKSEGRYYVSAIASIAPAAPNEGGCDIQRYALYTKVADYNSFILEKDAQFRPSTSNEDCETTGNNCQSTTVKPDSVPQVPGAECTLPDHPRFGQWKIYSDSFQYAPGTSVALGTVLQVTCQDRYILEGDSIVLCENGKWSSNIGTCIRTCPSVYSTSVLKATCIIKGKEVENCSSPFDGTQVKYECAPYYEDQLLVRNPIHVCRDGSWDHRPPQCVPVCGQKSVTPQTLIVNGSKVKKGEYPWQVAIYHEPKKDLICGGSLITERIILTAAHCVTNFEGKLRSKDSFSVAVGKYYRKFDDSREDIEDVQIRKLRDIYIPTQYQGQTQNFLANIAILVTSTPFILSRSVQPVCVDWASKYENLLVNYTGYVTGWGFTEEDAKPSDELQELAVPVISTEQCKEELPSTFTRYLTYDKICAGYRNQNKTVCSGDSGGGLVIKYDGRYYITGIIAVGVRSDTGGCNSQQYAIYTKISTYIENFISQKVSLFPTF